MRVVKWPFALINQLRKVRERSPASLRGFRPWCSWALVGTPLGGTRCRRWQLPCGTVWAYTQSTGAMGAWLPSPRFLRTPGRGTGSEPHPWGESLLQTPVSRSGPGREPLHGKGHCRDPPSAQRGGGAGPPRTSGAGPLSHRPAEAGPLPQYVQSVGCSPAFKSHAACLVGFGLAQDHSLLPSLLSLPFGIGMSISPTIVF